VGYSTLCRNLGEWQYRLKRPRPKAHLADPVAQADFAKKVQTWWQDETVDLWFCDETSFWGDPPRYRVWARKGSQPTVPYLGQHFRTCVMGAVRPRDGKFVSLLVSTGDSPLFQIFLDHLKQHLDPGRQTRLILDNVSFHKAKSLDWGPILPTYLPSYSPELNPIELLWGLIKPRHFKQRLALSQDHLDDRVAEALVIYQDNPAQVKKTCSMAVYF
jgi:hypothetical protein